MLGCNALGAQQVRDKIDELDLLDWSECEVSEFQSAVRLGANEVLKERTLGHQFSYAQSTLILETLDNTPSGGFRDEWVGHVPVIYAEDDCHRRIVSDFTINMLKSVYSGEKLDGYLNSLGLYPCRECGHAVSINDKTLTNELGNEVLRCEECA